MASTSSRAFRARGSCSSSKHLGSAQRFSPCDPFHPPHLGRGPCGGQGQAGAVASSLEAFRNDSEGGGGNWVDGAALRRTYPDLQDGIRHLANVRVARSNPFFRSKNFGSELGKRR